MSAGEYDSRRTSACSQPRSAGVTGAPARAGRDALAATQADFTVAVPRMYALAVDVVLATSTHRGTLDPRPASWIRRPIPRSSMLGVSSLADPGSSQPLSRSWSAAACAPRPHTASPSTSIVDTVPSRHSWFRARLKRGARHAWQGSLEQRERGSRRSDRASLERVRRLSARSSGDRSAQPLHSQVASPRNRQGAGPGPRWGSRSDSSGGKLP